MSLWLYSTFVPFIGIHSTVIHLQSPVLFSKLIVNTTAITNTLITTNIAQIGAHNIDFATIFLPGPNYANGQSFNTDTYTALVDGFIRARCDINTQGNKSTTLMTVDLTRNGVTTTIISKGYYFDVSAYNHAYVDKTFPVKAGDTIELALTGNSGSWTSRDFYPVLW